MKGDKEQKMYDKVEDTNDNRNGMDRAKEPIAEFGEGE